MTSDTWLFILIITIIGVASYAIATNKMTPKERDEMLNDPEMWP